jgi:hypothetical protein
MLIFNMLDHSVSVQCIYSVHCGGLLDIQNILLADTGISQQTDSNSFGDHPISDSLGVMPSSVTEVSTVLCSVSL